MQGEDTPTSWAVFGQHLVDSHGQARPGLSYIETGEIIQTLSLNVVFRNVHPKAQVT